MKNKNNNAEQLQFNFNPYNQVLKVDYAFNNSEYWKKLVKQDLMKIVGGDGESIQVAQLIPSVRSEIENILYLRGMEAEFRTDKIVIHKAPEDRRDEYDASYRPRA